MTVEITLSDDEYKTVSEYAADKKLSIAEFFLTRHSNELKMPDGGILRSKLLNATKKFTRHWQNDSSFQKSNSALA